MAFTGDDGAVRLDLVDGTVAPLLPGRVLAADPRSGLVVLRIDDRWAYYHRGRIDYPVALQAIEGEVLPLAVAPGGGAVALQVRRGARTHLLRHRVADDRLTEVDVPVGIIGNVGAWSATGLRFPYSSPVCPGAIATVGKEWHLAGDDGAARVPAHLEWFPCRMGDVEAVVYGDWRTADKVVLALHGGPDAAWDMGWQPALAAARRSGMRGRRAQPARQHRVRRRARRRDPARLGRARPHRRQPRRAGAAPRTRPTGARAPILFGESYGAYLALLAAGHRPDLWSGCAAVAPFLSGDRLHAEASPTMRAAVERLGGRGGADVLAVARRIDGPLLVVHGDRDPTVPVSQSRALHHHLRRPGHTRLEYVEVAGAGQTRWPRPRAPDPLPGRLTRRDVPHGESVTTASRASRPHGVIRIRPRTIP